MGVALLSGTHAKPKNNVEPKDVTRKPNMLNQRTFAVGKGAHHVLKLGSAWLCPPSPSFFCVMPSLPP